MLADLAYHCPARRAAEAAAVVGRPLRRYLFKKVLGAPLSAFGASHGFDTFIAFGHEAFLGHSLTADEKIFQGRLMDRLLNFARTGDPSLAGEAAWPPYDSATDAVLALDTSDASLAGWRRQECNFWAGYGL
jgi:carboxylesterase type B